MLSVLMTLVLCYKMADEEESVADHSCPTPSEEESKTEQVELTEEEKRQRTDDGNDLKGKGNDKFKSGGDCVVDTYDIYNAWKFS